MSRSNSFSSTFTAYTLITTAFQLANIYQPEDTIDSYDYNIAFRLLNSMIKDMECDGIKLWKRKIGTLFTDKNTASYLLGSTGTNATNSYNSSTLTVTKAAAQTALTIASSAGMSINDFVGIQLDDGTRQWTTIASIGSSTTITLAVGLTSQASSGNSIVSYTTKISRPLKITRANSFDLVSNSENQLDMLSNDEYFDMPIKTTPGRPNNAMYDKQLDNGVLYLYPTPNKVTEIVKFTYFESLMDMVNQNDNFDFPQEWNHTLLYNLVVELCYPYQKFVELGQYQAKAEALKQKAKQWDGDEESLVISVSRRRYK